MSLVQVTRTGNMPSAVHAFVKSSHSDSAKLSEGEDDGKMLTYAQVISQGKAPPNEIVSAKPTDNNSSDECSDNGRSCPGLDQEGKATESTTKEVQTEKAMSETAGAAQATSTCDVSYVQAPGPEACAREPVLDRLDSFAWLKPLEKQDWADEVEEMVERQKEERTKEKEANVSTPSSATSPELYATAFVSSSEDGYSPPSSPSVVLPSSPNLYNSPKQLLDGFAVQEPWHMGTIVPPSEIALKVQALMFEISAMSKAALRVKEPPKEARDFQGSWRKQ